MTRFIGNWFMCRDFNFMACRNATRLKGKTDCFKHTADKHSSEKWDDH